VRIGDDGGRAERKDQPGELVHEQLRRLEMHVGIDEPGDDVLALRIDRLPPVVGAEAGDVTVDDGDVRGEPLAGEDREHTSAAHDQVGGLVPACDRQTARER
jgi:hypothetical protein